MLKNFDELINYLPFYAKFFTGLCFNHGFNDLHINRNTYFRTVKLVKIIHRLRVPISCYNHFHIFWEVLRQPKSDISLFISSSINEVVNALKYKNDFIEDFIHIFNDLSFYFLIAYIQPVSKIVSEFFLMKFYFLSDIELFSKFDKNTINSVIIIGVVASCSGKV